MRIWELTTGRLVRTLKGVSQHVRVRACWSGSEKYVLSADTTSRYDAVCVCLVCVCWGGVGFGCLLRRLAGNQWLRLLGAQRCKRTPHNTCARVRARAFIQTIQSIKPIAPTDGRAVVAWDVNSGEVVGRLVGHANVTRYLQASPTEEVFFSCSDDHRGRFWVVE